MTTRRQFVLAGALGALAGNAPAAFSQSRKPVKIGILGPRPLADSFYAGPVVRRLAELGYREGTGTTIEYRSSDGIAERYPKQTRELIELKCDVIVALGVEPAARALRDARASVPGIFFAVDFDPLERGIVRSLSRPEGNLTGVYVPQSALAGKRLEIMREVVPAARRFLVFVDDFSIDQVSGVRKAAQASGVELTVIEFKKQPYDLAAAFEAGRKAQAEALIGLASPVFAGTMPQIVELCMKYRLPSAGTGRAMAERGFLLSYGVNLAKTVGRVAELTDRILKGAKPADVPVEQADEFELVINTKVARALGMKIPESVLARATRIVQ